jgi:hypothetical protein
MTNQLVGSAMKANERTVSTSVTIVKELRRVSTMRMRTLRAKCLKTAMHDNSAAANENQEDYYRQDDEHAASEFHAI